MSQTTLSCDPLHQIDAWINGTKDQMLFWERVLRGETWTRLGETEKTTLYWICYFEGQWKMAKKFKEFIDQKTIK